MSELPTAPVMRVVKRSVGDAVLWTEEAKAELISRIEAYIEELAERAAESTLGDGRVKARPEDFEGTRRPAEAKEATLEDYATLKETYDDYLVYVGMLEEGLKRANTALRENGFTPVTPKGQYAPKRIIMVSGGKDNRGTPVVHE